MGYRRGRERAHDELKQTEETKKVNARANANFKRVKIDSLCTLVKDQRIKKRGARERRSKQDELRSHSSNIHVVS